MEKNIKELKAELLVLLKKDAFRKGSFVLSSGKTSSYYLDARLITLSAQGAYLAASVILEMIKDNGVDALGGPTIGADPISGAVACLSHAKNIPLKTFIVRKAAKEHGTQRQIEGPPLKASDKVVLVDDVATTGKALLEALDALDKVGAKVLKAIVIVDRNEGAKETLAARGVALEAIFNIKEFGV
jgi:orotate phosphoribosyltransferase